MCRVDGRWIQKLLLSRKSAFDSPRGNHYNFGIYSPKRNPGKERNTKALKAVWYHTDLNPSIFKAFSRVRTVGETQECVSGTPVMWFIKF